SPKAHPDRGPLVGEIDPSPKAPRPGARGRGSSPAAADKDQGRRKRTSSSPLGDAISDAARRVASRRDPEPDPESEDEPALAAGSGVQFCQPRRLESLPERGEIGHLTAIALFANLVRRRATGRL